MYNTYSYFNYRDWKAEALFTHIWIELVFPMYVKVYYMKIEYGPFKGNFF